MERRPRDSVRTARGPDCRLVLGKDGVGRVREKRWLIAPDADCDDFVEAVARRVAISAATLVQSERLDVVLPRDAVPAIDKPVFEPASAAHELDDRETVLGIVGERDQRVYSTWQHDRHEIVNDTFEGRPIAVTW